MKNFILKDNNDGTVITLGDLQNKSLEILKGFDKICNEHQIEYALAYGTALGAKRHLGFIPWDDDVDVMMDYENYDKLISVLSNNDINPFYFHSFETDTKYNVTLPQMKFRLKDTYVVEKNSLLKNKCEGNGLFIDVFIVDHLSDSKVKNNFRRFISMLVVPLLVLLDNLNINFVFLKSFYVNSARRYSKRNQNSNTMGVSLTWVYDYMRDGGVEKSLIQPYGSVQFEDGIFPCAHDLDAYLKAVYSDTYMEWVPEHQRKPKHIQDLKL